MGADDSSFRGRGKILYCGAGPAARLFDRERRFLLNSGPMNLIEKIREKCIQRVQYLKRTYVYGGYVFVSFPKSGRTWVRLMLEDLGVSLKYDHAGSRHAGGALHMDDLPDPVGWKGRKIIFMHRCPRDTVVSGYHQARHRTGQPYEGSLSDFIRDPHHGIGKVVKFNNLWLSRLKDFPESSYIVVTYEDMKAGTRGQMEKILRFVNKNISPARLEKTIADAEFSKMQKREKSGGLMKKYGAAFAPADNAGPSGLKARKGKVGGYREEMQPEDILYCEDVLKRAA